MRLGVVILPELPWQQQQVLWRRAEELGFAHGWTYDHLAWRSLRDEPWYGALPTLTAAATVTTTMRLGTLVASPNFRHPVPFAKELIALDDVSGGRFTLGIGSGGTGWDATVLGGAPWSVEERRDRFTEFVDLLDRTLRSPETTFSGRFYSADGARTYPGCVQRPRIPFVVAATGSRAMAVAARWGDGWVTTGDPTGDGRPDVVARQSARLDDACKVAGRDPATLERYVLTGVGLRSGLESVEAFRDTVGRYAELGVTEVVVHWPRVREPFAGDEAAFEHIISSL